MADLLTPFFTSSCANNTEGCMWSSDKPVGRMTISAARAPFTVGAFRMLGTSPQSNHCLGVIHRRMKVRIPARAPSVWLRRTVKTQHESPLVVELKHAGAIGNQAAFLAIKAAVGVLIRPVQAVGGTRITGWSAPFG